MKRCLYTGCGLLNDDSAEVCKYCNSTNLRKIEDDKLLSGVSTLNVGLLDPPKVQAQLPPADTAEAEPQIDPKPAGGQTNGTRSKDQKHDDDQARAGNQKFAEDQKPPEVRPSNRIKVTAAQVWQWSREQLRNPLIGGAVGFAGLFLAVISAPQLIYVVDNLTNDPPVIRNVLASPSVIQLGEEVRLTAWADDAEEGTLVNYQWINSAGTILGTGPGVTLITKGMDRGSAPNEISVTLTVTDSQQLPSKPYSVPIRISTSKPRLKSIEPDKMEVRVGEPVRLVAVAEDPGGERAGKLHYEWHCPVGQIDQSDDYRTTLQTAGLNLRSAAIFPKVRVTVTNDRGESTEGEITLSITPAVREIRHKKNPPTNTTTLIIGVKEPLILDSKTPGTAAPQPQTSPVPQSSTTPPEAPSPGSKQTTKSPP